MKKCADYELGQRLVYLVRLAACEVLELELELEYSWATITGGGAVSRWAAALVS